jgi:ribonuclease R
MEFSIAALLANFTDDKLVAPKVLEKKLECEDEASLRKLQIALDALEKIGVLVKDRGRYRRIFEEGVVEGKLRCSSKGFCFAIQDVEGAEDIYIRESQLNTAWNGDRVLVRITKEGSRKRSPEGEVRLILERSNPSVLARVKQAEESFRAVPLDDRLLFELELQQNGQALEKAIDHLVHVEVLRYPLGQNPPIGRVAQVLGSDSDAADIDIVFCKHDLPRSFPPAVLDEASGFPKKIPKADLKKRLDLRELLTIAIEGFDSQPALSVDDALTLEQTEDGNWQLGVHIADVSHYIGSNSALDREAQKRGFTVYLGDTMLPMLPESFTDRISSLQPGQDRLTLSVIFLFTLEGDLLEFELQPSVIQVDHLLTYEQAQAVLEREDLAEDDPHQQEIEQLEPIYDMLDQLFTLSQMLKEQRQQRGAFELNLPEKSLPGEEGTERGKPMFTRFHYKDEGALGAMVVSPALPVRSMVAEFMLLANQSIATHLHELGVPGVYRVHPHPDPEDVQELIKLAANMGIDLHLQEEDVVHAEDYQRFTQKFAEFETERVLTYLLLETLKPAFYSTTAKPHFGLALPQGYTHFTAPLRRYPDLLVHRVLHAIFEQGRDRKSTRSKETVDLRSNSCHGKVSWNVLPTDIQQELETQFASLVIHLSEREKVAQEAEEDLEGLKKAELMRERTGEIFHGLITGVQSYGLFVEIEELLVEGLVHVSSLKDDWYEYRSRQQTLVGRKNRKQYRLGDRIEVQVKSVDYYRQQIDLVAVGGGSDIFEPEEPGEAHPPEFEDDFEEDDEE